RIACEHVGVPPPVVADDDERGVCGIRIGLLEHIGGKARRRLRDQHAIHAVAAGAERPAQPRRAELQASSEAVLEVGDRVGVARLRALDDLPELGAGLAVRILREPRPRLLEHRLVHSAPTIPARSLEMTGSAWRPASITSWWLRGVVWMPAAMFVMSDMPSTSMPASRAAMASSAVDMPTM